jgi:hypothetical protein
MRCEICGKRIEDLEEEKQIFWDQFDDDFLEDAEDTLGWDFGNSHGMCAYELWMEEYYENHPESRHQNYDDDERREDPSDNYWPDD